MVAHNASLIVVDSIAAILRAEFSQSEVIERQRLVGEQASRLKDVAHKFNIPVVVTNQVIVSGTASMSDVTGDGCGWRCQRRRRSQCVVRQCDTGIGNEMGALR